MTRQTQSQLERKAALYKMLMIVSGVALVATVTAAQSQTPPANPGPGNPAINKSEGKNPGAPVAGANSFTEGQAKSRLESNGYMNVTALKKDDDGVWRGKAQKDGKSVDVSLDFQGNIVAK
jgi:hypothetical protein